MNRLVLAFFKPIIGDPMGLDLYTADYDSDPPSEETDPNGSRALFFEMMRELSDVAEARVVGMNGSKQVLLRIPQDEVQRAHRSIGECVPPNRMKDFLGAIDRYVRHAEARLGQLNGHASTVETGILHVSLRLSTTIKKLMYAAVKGEEPAIENDSLDDEHASALRDVTDEFDGFPPDDEWEAIIESGEGAIVPEEDEEDGSVDLKESLGIVWESELEDGDDDDDEQPDATYMAGTPDPSEIDPEDETLILAEAAEMIVDMNMIVDDFRQMQEYLAMLSSDEKIEHPTDDYQDVIIAVMRHVAAIFSGKTNLECLAIELESEAVSDLMKELNEIERVGCLASVFHNVAESALMQVDMFSDMVNANADGDDAENDANLQLTLTFIQRLKERFDIL